jgi:DNA-directed RNA polymerase specialized sigma24 family protein
MYKHKSQANNRKSSNLPKNSKIVSKCNGVDLDQLGIELDTLARRSLRDGVLLGILKGHEEEVRQDAIILALEWFFRPTNEPESSANKISGSAWHAPRAMAKALKIAKLRYLDSLSKSAKLTEPFNEGNVGTTRHPSDLLPSEWPESVTREFIRKGIQVALKLGRISPANACVARLILLHRLPVAQVAKRLGVHRSAIDQQRHRILKKLPAVFENIEAPPMA